MRLSKVDFVIIGLIIVSFIFAITIYPLIPEKMPTHWNIWGEIDGYGNKFVGLFLIPLIALAIYLLFLFIPKIDPLKKNIVSFINHFDMFKLLTTVFFLCIYIITLLPNFGIKYNLMYFLVPAIAVFFYYIGYIMKFAKRNYFIGIRTPWTLADDTVWDKTHKIGSVTFRINAVIILLALVSPLIFFWVFIASIIVNFIFLVIYSYFVWKKLKK